MDLFQNASLRIQAHDTTRTGPGALPWFSDGLSESNSVFPDQIEPALTDLIRPEMWPIFEYRHVSKYELYSLSDFQGANTSFLFFCHFF